MGGGVSWLSYLWWCQGGCERERRIEAIVKIYKNKIGGGGSGQGGCERRIKVFVSVKMHFFIYLFVGL